MAKSIDCRSLMKDNVGGAELQVGAGDELVCAAD